MNRFARWIVKHRVAVVIICLLMLIPSVLGMNATKVKYDLLYYLPEDLDTVKGQNILMEEFGKGAFSLCITEGMSETDQQALEDAIRDVPHVDTVIGYASITKGTIPSEILPDEYRNIFEKGDARLMAVFFDDTSSAEGTMEAIAQIRKIAGQQCFVSGLSAVVTDTKQLVEDQEAIYVAIAVALCCVVLMLTMDSILLPFIFLLCIGVSILWNMGTNYFLGEISYITKAVAAVLQLGVTLDYSIFLWHSYKEEQQTCSDKDEAMASAICKTISSIVGSSLTTVAGFVAICFMSFTLGRDLGIVMSKGVILGVLGTVILLPCVIVYWAVGVLTAATVLGGIALILAVSLLVLVLSCLLGWVVAKIHSKLKRKNLLTTLIALAFFALYYMVCFRANELIEQLMLHLNEVGAAIRGSAYPLYLMGRMGAGDYLAVVLVLSLIHI